MQGREKKKHLSNLSDTAMAPLICQTNSGQRRKKEEKKSTRSKMSSERSQSPIRQVKLMLGGVAEVPAVAAVWVSFSLSGITERARAPLIARCHPLTAPLHLAGVGPAGAPAALGEAESSAGAVSHTQRRRCRHTFHLYKSDVRRESHRATCSGSSLAAAAAVR